MKEDLDIIKMLRAEERLGILTTKSQGSYERLATSGEVFEDMSNKNISVMKDAVEADSLFSEDEKDGSSILDVISDWICLLNKDHRIIRTNLAVEKITGLSPSDVIGQTCCKIVHGLDKPLPGCPLEKMLLSRKRESLEIQIPDSNRWLKVTVDPATDDKGNITGALHIVSDITERKKAEEQIQNLAKFPSENPNPVFRVGKKGDIIYANNAGHSLSNCKKCFKDSKIASTSWIKIIENSFKSNSEKVFEFECKNRIYSFVVAPVINEGYVNLYGRDITEKKKVETKVEYQANILQNVNDAIISVDSDFNITSWNKAAEIMYGWKEKEVLGKNSFEVTKLEYSSDNIEKSLDEQIKKFYDVGSWEGNVIQHHKNGKTLQVYVSVTFIRDAQGNPVGNVTINRDVTEQKKAEEKIKNILESSPDSIVVSDLEGNITECNEATLKLHGFSSKEELIGKSAFMFFPERDQERATENLQKALKEGSVKNIEYTLLTKDGKEFSAELSASVINDASGKPVAFVAITKDNTERKEAEERTKQQNKINILRAEIWELAAKPLFENELIQQLVDKIGSFFNLEHVSFLRIYPEKKKAIVDIQWRKKDSKSGIGEEFPLWLLKRYFGKPYRVISLRNIPSAAKPIVVPIFKKFDVKSTLLIPYGDIDNPQGYIATADRKADKEWSKDEIDIFSEMIGIILLKSEEIKSEEKAKKHQIKIEQQNIQLKRLDRIKTDFLNATSHELRTPMAAIKGYIQMLLKQTLGDVTPEQKDALNVVLRNTDRLDHLVQDILDISRLESGTMKFIQEKTDISKMIKESLQTMQYNADIKNIKINTELGKNIPALTIDQERIKQVITNLVDNAIKFSPPNSTVMIRAKKDKTNVLFEVQDWGRGIPKNKQKKIFERFYQVESGMDRKFGGVGLGLTISQGIVKSHGGNIWIDNSTKDKGSTFKFNLPIDSVENIEEKFKQMDIFNLENNK